MRRGNAERHLGNAIRDGGAWWAASRRLIGNMSMSGICRWMLEMDGTLKLCRIIPSTCYDATLRLFASWSLCIASSCLSNNMRTSSHYKSITIGKCHPNFKSNVDFSLSAQPMIVEKWTIVSRKWKIKFLWKMQFLSFFEIIAAANLFDVFLPVRMKIYAQIFTYDLWRILCQYIS